MLHLQGMGLVGSGVAWTLYKHGIPFTWSDNYSHITAWKACTGAVFPSANERDKAGYARWTMWYDGQAPWIDKAANLGTFMERADYWYCTKAAPHGMKVEPVGMVGSLKLHPQPSYHLNAQELVTKTRAWFAQYHRDEAPGDATVIVTNGFNPRLKRYVWGWTELVELDTRELKLSEQRACIYLRRGRLIMAYAYPVPGTENAWYAGSTLLVQKDAKSRAYAKDMVRWRKNWDELTGGLVPVVRALEPPVEGWRPSTGPVDQESTQPYWMEVDGQWNVMPMWHSGVRWLPNVVDALMETVLR